jgi:outer membrane receptor for ferrienterochelin and colicins
MIALLSRLLLLGLMPVCCAFSAQAQLSVLVLDAVNGQGIAYAHVAVQPLSNGPARLVVTDPAGRADVELPAEQVTRGVVLRVSYMGYATITDTVRTTGTHTLRLVRSAVGLGEVVVTGQYAPGSPEKAVHKVRVLNAQQFQRMAANNLGEALRNELNIRLAQDNILGTSISMQGLGGENVKILIDGIPVVGRQDGNVDLAQLDLTGIERVEIVEGPLSVSYGTNALAGTINLITRKGSKDSPSSLKASVYAEHIGRLNTTLSGTHAWGRNSVVLTAGRNFFDGWDPREEGLSDLSPQLADSTRYQQWKPREQYFGRLNYRWSGGQWAFGYKGELMHDRIIAKGRPRAPYYETAFDEEFVTVRLDNAVFAEYKATKDRRLNLLAAYNSYQRTRNTWYRDLTTLADELAPLEGMQDTAHFGLTNVRGTFSRPRSGSAFGYELGGDVNVETGTGERISDGNKEIGDYAAFASMEYAITDSMVVRPGLRYAYNTRYEAPLVPSLNVRWQLTSGFTLRASYAQGFRAPSLKELHFFFVDVNHDIVGNPDLLAERSHNANVTLSYRHAKEKGVYTSELSGFYNDIQDLISLAQITGTRYTYINVGRYRTAGGSVGTNWDNGHWIISLGASITGRYDELAQELNEPWLFTPEVRGSLTRRWLRKGWSGSIFWKYQGELSNYQVVDDVDVIRTFIAPYHLADATISKTLFAQRLTLSAGCKDLFDVQNVQASMSQGAHSGGGVSVPMTTGRTYFLRLEVDLKHTPKTRPE